MKLDAAISSVTFLPRMNSPYRTPAGDSFIKVNGMAWSPQFNTGRIVSDRVNTFNLKWFWYADDVPVPIADVLIEAAKAATDALVEKKALPTLWPTGLMAEEQIYPFDIAFKEITIFNAKRNSQERLSEARLIITSKHHLPTPKTGDTIDSTVGFDISDELNSKIFQTLEDHL
jgi:hypothetical protein